MTSFIDTTFNYLGDWLPLDHHSSIINFSSALGYEDLEMGMCFGIQRMGTQAVCAKELDVFNNRVKRIYSLWIRNLGSYSRVVSHLRREISEAITQKDTSRIESAVDLLAFAECAAVAQTSEAFSYLIDEVKDVRGDMFLSKIKELTYSKKIEALGGLETIGIAIDQYSVETFEKYITELKTIAKRASVEFLILEFAAEHHAVTIIYSPNDQCWYCIDANDLPIQQNRSDQVVSKWVFQRYNLFHELSKKRLLISTNVQLLGKDLKCSQAFEKWREIQKKNRLRRLAPDEINQRDHYNTAPLQAVAGLERLSGSSYAPMLCSLLDRGADPNYTDKSSITPLMDVVKAEDIEAVKLLLARGANVNTTSIKGWTALMHASRNGNREIVKALLEAGADLEVKTSDDWTALMLASRCGNAETVKALLEAGADLDVKTKDNWTALMLAASRHGNAEIVKALLEAGADLEVKTKDNSTALMLACRYVNSEMVKALLEVGADFEVKTNDNWTALMLASRYGNAEIVKALSEAGADPDIKSKDNWTALMLASRYGNSEMVKALLEVGADLEVKTKDNWTALMIASRYGNIEMVKALLEAGADPDIKSKDGWTALALAKGLDATEMVEALLAAEAKL